MKRKLFVFVLLAVLAFTACDISLSDTPVLDNVENTLPYITYVDSGTVIGSVQSATLVEPEKLPVKDGFILSGWAYDAKGTCPVTAWNTTITESVTIYAIWTVDTSSEFVFVSSETGDDEKGDGSKDAPFKTIRKALEESEKIFIEGTFTENINISADNAVIISGLESPVVADSEGRAVPAEGGAASLIKGTFTLADGAELTLRNLAVAPETAGAYAISATNGVSVSIDNVYINTSTGGRGINIAAGIDTEGPIDKPVDVNLNFSAIILNGENSRGVNIDGSFDQTKSGSERVSISLSDSTIVQPEDDETNVYPVQVFRSELADLEMNNVFINITKNYYAFRFFDVGSNDGPESTISIRDSYLKAWAAFYVQANTRNVKAEVVDSTLVGVGQNSGTSDDFATISIDSSSNVKLNVVDSEIVFDKSAEAAQQAVAIYYYDYGDLTYGGNLVSFENCDFKLEGENETNPGVMAFVDNITGKSTEKVDIEDVQSGTVDVKYDELAPVKKNEIVFDAASLASLTRQGYVYEKTKDEVIWNLQIPCYENPSRPYDGYAYRFDEDIYMFAYEDGVDKGFAGGIGTQEHPYLVENEDQFAKISSLGEEMEAGAYYYFSVESDLDYSTGDANPHILKFRGEIDFNGHTLGGLSFARLKELNDGKTANNLIETCYGGAIKNLDYQPVGQCNLVYKFSPNNEENKELLLENITAGKETSPRFDVGGNGGSFAGLVLGPAKLVIRNCTNYCDIDVIYSGYAGIFLSGYGKSSAEIVFENCDNYGTVYAKNYGFLIGNDSGINEKGYSSITATNCDNHGEIYATQSCGFVGWDDEKYTSVYTGSNNTTGTIKKLDSVSAQTSLSKDNVITVSGLDSGKYTSYEIVAYGYGDLKSTDGGGGTLRIVVSSGRIEITDSSTFKKLNFIDKAHAGNVFADDAYGNEIATVDGVEYYSIDLDSLGTALYDVEFKAPDYTLSELTYSLNVYNQEGNLAGSKTLTF